MDGELEFDWKLRLEKFEEDRRTLNVRKVDTKICDHLSDNPILPG